MNDPFDGLGDFEIAPKVAQRWVEDQMCWGISRFIMTTHILITFEGSPWISFVERPRQITEWKVVISTW